MFISMLSGVPIVYVVERDIYQFKTKKIPTIVVGSLSVASLVYPVHNNFDFNIISAIVSVAMLVSIIIPVDLYILLRRLQDKYEESV